MWGGCGWVSVDTLVPLNDANKVPPPPPPPFVRRRTCDAAATQSDALGAPGNSCEVMYISRRVGVAAAEVAAGAAAAAAAAAAAGVGADAPVAGAAAVAMRACSSRSFCWRKALTESLMTGPNTCGGAAWGRRGKEHTRTRSNSISRSICTPAGTHALTHAHTHPLTHSLDRSLEHKPHKHQRIYRPHNRKNPQPHAQSTHAPLALTEAASG